MALTQPDALHWSDIDTVTIDEGAFLLYGIEPHSFKNEDAYSLQAHLEFYDRNIGEDIAHLAGILERAALAGSIEIAHRVMAEKGNIDREKTQLKKSSFLAWCESNPKHATVAPALDLATYQAENETPDATANTPDWIAKSIELADKIAVERGGGPRKKISARSVCDAVAIELGALRDPSYCSSRGVPYSSSIVRTQALKGWKYPR